MHVIRGEAQRTFLLCVDSYLAGVPQGRVYTPAFPEGKNFASLLEMLWLTEQSLDDTNFPQAFSKMRSFTADKSPLPSETQKTALKRGKAATLAVRIFFRQNASWQGCANWVEGNTEESFRSALELCFLMKSALENKRTVSA
ncbi:MAG: hypothetical protein IKD06_04615 [Clostridia bacterium]|nr:hypothetical protein [Clostridia bacterium]